MKKKEKKCNHEWWVHSTDPLMDAFLLHCEKCNAFGTVANPTKEEWLNTLISVPSDPDNATDEEIERCFIDPYEMSYWEHKDRVVDIHYDDE